MRSTAEPLPTPDGVDRLRSRGDLMGSGFADRLLQRMWITFATDDVRYYEDDAESTKLSGNNKDLKKQGMDLVNLWQSGRKPRHAWVIVFGL